MMSISPPLFLSMPVYNWFRLCYASLKRRKIKDRPRDPAKWDEIADVVSALSIPVIANGDVFGYEDFKRIKDATGFCFYLPCHLLVCSDKFGSSPLSVSNLETAFFNMHLFGLPQNFNRFLNAVCH